MRFAIAAILFVFLLFMGGVGWVTTSFLVDMIDDELTTPERLSMLGGNASDFEDNVSVLTLGHNVAWVVYFLIVIVWFVIDSLRREPETYYPSDMRGRY